MTRLNRSISIIAITFVTSTSHADRPAPERDYVVEVDGGEYVFVMLVTDDLRANHDLREKWAQSGLYLLNDSSEPLWTVDWYARSVIPIADGVRLIRWGPWAETIDDIAVAFYSRGEELNHYHIRELIDDESMLERSVSHFTWNTGWKLAKDSGVLTIKMTDGQEHKFDTAKGVLIDKE